MDEGKRSRCIICNCYTTTQQGHNIFTTKLEDGDVLLSTFLKNVLDCSVLIIIPPDFFLCHRCYRLCSELDYSLERCNKLQEKIKSLFNISKANQEAYYNGAEPVELQYENEEDEKLLIRRHEADDDYGEDIISGEAGEDYEYDLRGGVNEEYDEDTINQEEAETNYDEAVEEGNPCEETVEDIQAYLTSLIKGGHEVEGTVDDTSQLVEDGEFWPPNQEIFYEEVHPSEITEDSNVENTEEVETEDAQEESTPFVEFQKESKSTQLFLSGPGKESDIIEDPLGMIWYCKPCKEKFNSLELLKIHKKSETCKSTCKNFEIKSAYEYKNYTIKLKHKQKVFFCNYCTFEATKSSTMDKHVETHKTDPVIMCDVCGRRYKSNRTFKKHMKTHDESRPFGCKSCTFRSATELTMRIHQRIHDDQQKFSCSKCSYKSSKKLSYLNHLRTHTGERPYCCPDCPYRAKDSSTLIRHRRIHGGLKRYHCTNCDYKSVQKNALKRHMMVHTGEKPHSCPHCDYSSTMKCNLVDHIMAKHSTEKPYACDLCDYKAKAKRLLTYHMRIHSNEKPFPCTLCEFRGRHRGSLSYHMKSKHGSGMENKSKKTLTVKFVHFPGENVQFSDEDEDGEPYEIVISNTDE